MSELTIIVAIASFLLGMLAMFFLCHAHYRTRELYIDFNLYLDRIGEKLPIGEEVYLDTENGDELPIMVVAEHSVEKSYDTNDKLFVTTRLEPLDKEARIINN